MAHKPKSKWEKLTKGELREYVALRLSVGWAPAQLQRELGYRSRTPIDRLVHDPEVEARVANLKLRQSEGYVIEAPAPPNKVKPAKGSAEGDVSAPLPIPDDVNGRTLDDCAEMAHERLYEVLKYGTYLGRRIDPDKIGLKAIVEVMDRLAKAKGRGGDDDRGAGGGAVLTEARLAELRREGDPAFAGMGRAI